ncbi:MAG TPA: glycosyltransferase family 2 protein [Actinomycetales bacterium]|nr:glycosyltransferase family 2 protein [Actinomycetales bacterium]
MSILRRSRAARRPPTLSVVMPLYEVEEYLPACLDSIATQPFEDYELVVVDDGSPDASGDIASSYARRDNRILVIRRPNGGQGAARNTGVRAARGRLLTFVDSDDMLPPDAWSRMVDTLGQTASDLVVGNVERDDGNRRWTPPLMRVNHARDRLAVTVDEMPLVLADVFPWNKVYRRAFWDAAGLGFPEGVRYEDQPALTRAFLAARAFDVLSETVYLWRVRGDRSSITQRRHEITDLRDRFDTKRTSALLVEQHGVAEVARVFHADVLPVDMWEYFRAVPGCSEEFWQLLVAGVRELWNHRTVAFEHTSVPVQQRLMGWLVAAGRRDDLVRLLEFIDRGQGGLPVEGGRFVHPWRDEPGMPDSLVLAEPRHRS